jgi:hypothetical protein
MRRTLLAVVSVLGTMHAHAATPLQYRFDDVKRSVTVISAGKPTAATKGSQAHGGDRVSTGWFSSALIASEAQQARFEIYSASEVTLAEDTPGVILSLERGRIRAIFDKITGSEPRIVKTPGALLAVRGTQFDIRVDRDGNTTVDVFEGLVEIRSPLRPEPLFVKPGEEAKFGRNRPPSSGPMPEHRRREGPNAQGSDPNRPRDGQRDGQRDPNRGGRRGDSATGGMGGRQQQPPPQQPPPQQPPPPRPPA